MEELTAPLAVPPRLYLNHNADLDRLVALEFGLVADGQPPHHWRYVSDDFSWLHPEEQRLGFAVTRFSTFDAEARRVDEIWRDRAFAAPTLGLALASAGEVLTAARAFFHDRSSINHHHLQLASASSGEAALPHWMAALQAGDASAHYGLGITLYELGRHQEAYRHLRHYTEIAPNASWNWCWYGRGAQALGLWKEARHAYEIAIELEDEGGEVTDARDLIADLDD